MFERTRELGLLRAVGMTRGQVRSMVRWESVVISLIGAITGAGLGIGIGLALARVLEDEGITAVSIPFAQLGAYVALAALAGVLAAVGPARRAANVDVLRAVVHRLTLPDRPSPSGGRSAITPHTPTEGLHDDRHGHHLLHHLRPHFDPRHTARALDAARAQGQAHRGGGGGLRQVALTPSVPAQADDTATTSVSADTPDCVSRVEWRQVYIVADGTGSGPGSGGTLRRIHRVFGTAGERVALDQPDPGFRYQVRRYQRCERAGWYRVTYHQYEADGVRTAWRSYWG